MTKRQLREKRKKLKAKRQRRLLRRVEARLRSDDAVLGYWELGRARHYAVNLSSEEIVKSFLDLYGSRP